ncbi:DUF952 domain-containing protein [Spirosoma agri]|uniref:DUF952 domain-containing protein n=1 Tax=Spirosoma agri TaxID=1987381 RepID=A0A6M0IK78_9BACT|nr:DUF952 domain-containing protein [Spirosoma agri]NEU68574.1 DUF952 domain-containing protein [Spirosoma agri]
MSLLYHVVPASVWATYETASMYEADSLRTEGFIHLSTSNQVNGVLDRYYRNVPDLLLLHVDPDRLVNELKYEVSTNNERFPHLYGPLNKDAVVTVERLTQVPINQPV